MIDWAFWLNYLEVCAVIAGFFLMLVWLDLVMGPGSPGGLACRKVRLS